jgi:hypothetical protein
VEAAGLEGGARPAGLQSGEQGHRLRTVEDSVSRQDRDRARRRVSSSRSHAGTTPRISLSSGTAHRPAFRSPACVACRRWINAPARSTLGFVLPARPASKAAPSTRTTRNRNRNSLWGSQVRLRGRANPPQRLCIAQASGARAWSPGSGPRRQYTVPAFVQASKTAGAS